MRFKLGPTTRSFQQTFMMAAQQENRMTITKTHSVSDARDRALGRSPWKRLQSARGIVTALAEAGGWHINCVQHKDLVRHMWRFDPAPMCICGPAVHACQLA